MPAVKSGPAARTNVIAIAVATLLAAVAHPAFADEPHTFRIAKADASTAVREFAQQSGVQIMASADALRDKVLNPVTGEHTTEEALDILLADTGLKHEFVGERGIVLRREDKATSPKTATTAPEDAAASNRAAVSGDRSRLRLAQDNSGTDTNATKKTRVQLEEVVVNVPEVLVRGSKSLNTDIRRTRDDAQPYTVFEREAIERAGATNVEDFLKQRLTMNTQNVSFSQTGNIIGSTSQINLRGLGTNQTLILIDGHRALGAIGGLTAPLQADLNSIPMAAVERIEVLPTTASGIYGGAATGGVVNVVLRRDYSGVEARLGYENTFASDASVRRVDFGSGFNFNDGRTNLLISGSYSEQNPLLAGERDFVAQYRSQVFQNNPGFFTDPSADPPLGRTANIRSADGSPLFGPGTPYFTSVPVGYAGGGGVAPLQTRAGQYNLDASLTAGLTGTNLALTSAPTNKALMMTLRHEFTPWLRGYVDVSGADNTSRFHSSDLFTTYFVNFDAPNNPFGQDLVVTVPIAGGDADIKSENDNRQAVAGVVFTLPHQWQLAADYTWQRSTWRASSPPFNQIFDPPLTSLDDFDAVATGAIDVLRDATFDISGAFVPLIQSPRRSTFKDGALRTSGPVGSLPGGPIVISALLEHRDEDFGNGYQFFGTSALLRPARSQRVSSAYLETKVPLFSERNARPFLRSLELQLAGRYDRYDVTGADQSVPVDDNLAPTRAVVHPKNHSSSTDPTVALRYQPVNDVILRASYGTGFLPPSLGQILPGAARNSNRGELDPRRGNSRINTILLTQGGSTDLEPEQSESRSVGVIFEPQRLPGLRLSLDWTSIRKTNNISVLSVQKMVDSEALFPGRIARDTNPSTFGSFGVGPIRAIDLSAINTARQEVSGYDLAADYNWQTDSWGEFAFYALASTAQDNTLQLLPGEPETGGVGHGIAKANAGLSWTYRGTTLAWSTRYFDSYAIGDPSASDYAQVVANQGGTRVPSQTYHDFFASYRFGAAGSRGRGLAWTNDLLSDLEVQFGVRNVFNKKPPLDASDNAVLFYSYLGDARLASYYLALKASF